MGWLKFILVLCALGGVVQAGASQEVLGGEPQETSTIQSWISHINTNYKPAANVHLHEDLHDPVVRTEIQKELFLLESVIRGEDTVPAGSLKLLDCENIVCGGGGNGGCVKCGGQQK